jgi:hypothetical protein
LAVAQAEQPPAPKLASVPEPVITSEADEALARMSQFLRSAKSLGFTAEVTYDVLLGDGQKIEYSSQIEAAWRPGKQLRVEVEGDEIANRIYIDRGKVTFVDDLAGIYATEQVPGDLDAAIDDVLDRLEINVPLANLFYADPYTTLIETAHWGRQVGLHEVRGVECIHLAFVADGLDWQIWIDAGEQPLPRKLVIDYRDQPGSPSYSAILTSWQMNPKLAKKFAKFSPSPSEMKVEFLIDQPGPAEGQP